MTQRLRSGFAGPVDFQHMPLLTRNPVKNECKADSLRRSARDLFLVICCACMSFLALGYHPGFEDDGVYLAAVERRVHPELFPHDFRFFTVQLQATIFDRFIAAWVSLTRMSIAWAELFWQCAAIVAILATSRVILQHFFASKRAQWAGVAMLGAMFALPVSGTALYILDQHLHPRALSTALILAAIALLLDRRGWRAVACLAGAFLFHPIMGAMGISFCFFLWLGVRGRLDWMFLNGDFGARPAVLVLLPLGWIFEPPTSAWRTALGTRTYYFLFQWHWYEWLGALGPILLFWMLAKWAAGRRNVPLARFAAAVVAYALVQQCIAIMMTGPPSLIRLIPLQPMRFLHLVYIFLVLVAGALLGEYVLRTSRVRWVMYLAVIYGGMFLSQCAIFADTPHLELPGMKSDNPWMQAFAWIRGNTPHDAYFAVDPWYLNMHGEDFHNFRPLAERSALADAVKDAAVCTQVPELADAWLAQRDAQIGLDGFSVAQLERLKAQTGADWVLLRSPARPGLDCRWHNHLLTVCRIP